MYLIIGGSGFLGSYFLMNILKYTREKIIATYNTNMLEVNSSRIIWERLDVSENNEVDKFCNKINSSNVKVKVIYLAAYHHPDKVRNNFSWAWKINICALSMILNKLENVQAFYYSSTEMVYGESKNGEIFNEMSPINPLNAYGKQKAAAEKLVNTYGYNVVRFPVLMGRGIYGKHHFTDQIIETLLKNNKIEMIEDSYRNMLDFGQAAYLTIGLIEKYIGAYLGVINIVADEAISKVNMAQIIAMNYGLDKKYIQPISMVDNKFYDEVRPKNIFVSNNKLKKLLKIDKININL